MASNVDIYADLVRIVDSDPQHSTTTYQQEWLTARTLEASYSKSALAHFTLPDHLLYKKITAIKLWAYVWIETSNMYDAKSLGLQIYALQSGFGPNVTWENQPRSYFDMYYAHKMVFDVGTFKGWLAPDAATFDERARGVLLNGIHVYAIGSDRAPTQAWVSTSETSKQLCVTVTYEDETEIPTVSGQPTGGYQPKQRPITFSWSITQPTGILGEYTVASCRLLWKQPGDADYTAVNCGTNLSYTMPANTVTGTSVTWYPEITFTNGTVVSPDEPYTISTQEPLGRAIPQSPINTIVDSTKVNHLVWQYTNSSGMLNTGADVQVSTDGSTWTDFFHEQGSQVYSCSFEDDDLPGGVNYWRVRAYNQDNAVGPWSNAVSFTYISAPPRPVVSATTVPYSTITWQVEGQQAYRIRVDGIDFGEHFGMEKRFVMPTPLSDGQHTAMVSVQGEYGLWSAWGSVTFTVQNQTEWVLELTGTFSQDAILTWRPLTQPVVAGFWVQGGRNPVTGSTRSSSTTVRCGVMSTDVVAVKAYNGLKALAFCWDANNTYLGACNGGEILPEDMDYVGELDLASMRQSGAAQIRLAVQREDGGSIVPADVTDGVLYESTAVTVESYTITRDGVQIGHTTDQLMTDRLVIGTHVWHVSARFADGTTAESNDLRGTVAVRESVIASIDGDQWLTLRLTGSSADEQSFSRTRTVSVRHVAGARYPVAEISPYEDLIGNYEAAFTTEEECTAFEALFGKVVVMKTKRGNLVIGPMVSLEKLVSHFYTGYTFSIQRIHWEGYDG